MNEPEAKTAVGLTLEQKMKVVRYREALCQLGTDEIKEQLIAQIKCNMIQENVARAELKAKWFGQ